MNLDNFPELDFESLAFSDRGAADITDIIDFCMLSDEVEFTTTPPATHEGPTPPQKILAALQRTPPERRTVPWVWLRNMLEMGATTIGALRATSDVRGAVGRDRLAMRHRRPRAGDSGWSLLAELQWLRNAN
jgi:hypothetical protein